MFADPSRERFVSQAEEKILKENEWPDGMRKYRIDGHIMIASVDENSVFFNAKFETANLSQVFRVPSQSSGGSR